MSVNEAIVRISPAELAWLRDADDDAITAKCEAWLWSATPRSCDFGTAHAFVHFLLTGVAPRQPSDGPLGFLANERFGETLRYQFSYGPGRVLAPGAVLELERALDALSAAVVDERLRDPALLAVYPSAIRPTLDDAGASLARLVDDLRTYVAATAAAGDALLVAVY
jgi:hypothetical protein